MKKKVKILCIMLVLLVYSKNATSFISSINNYHIKNEVAPSSDNPKLGDKTRL